MSDPTLKDSFNLQCRREVEYLICASEEDFHPTTQDDGTVSSASGSDFCSHWNDLELYKVCQYTFD